MMIAAFCYKIADDDDDDDATMRRDEDFFRV